MTPARDTGQEVPGWQGLHTSQSGGQGSKTRVPGPSLLACVEFPGDPETPPRPAYLLLQGHQDSPLVLLPSLPRQVEPVSQVKTPRGPAVRPVAHMAPSSPSTQYSQK